MDANPLDVYDRASDWTLGKVVVAAGRVGASTPCEGWTVGQLMSHMLDTHRYFVGAARGDDVPPPPPEPTAMLNLDPVIDFEHARAEALRTFHAAMQGDGADAAAPSIGIAASEQLLHGWDLARATGQDETMPDGLAEAVLGMIHGRFTDEQRRGVFKPEVPVAPGASAQDRLLAYTGRDPAPPLVTDDP